MTRRVTSTVFTLALILSSLSTYSQKPEISIQTGHAKQVLSVAFTRDGRFLASGSVDKTIKIWDTATGYELRALKGHTGTVNCVAFSPDEKFLASSSADMTVKLWDVSSGRELRTFRGHTMYVLSVAFSPDGKSIASGSADQSVKLWDVATGRELRTLIAEPNPKMSLGINVAFSPDGKTLAAGGERVRIFDLATGSAIRTLEINEVSRPVPELPVGFSRDGKIIATGGSFIKLWDAATGRQIRAFSGAEARSIAIHPSGKSLASCDLSSVKIWDLSTGEVIREIEGPKVGVDTVAFSADGETVALGNGDHSITLFEVATGREVRLLKGHTNAVTSLALNADGRTLANGLYSGIGRNDSIRVWDPVTGQMVRTLSGQSAAYSVGINAEGNKVVAGGPSGTTRMWDVGSSEIQRQFSSATPGNFVADRAAISSDGRLIAAGGRDSTIKIWEVASGRELFTLRGHKNGIWDLAFNQDGSVLASSGQDKTIRLWSTTTGKQINLLSGPNGGIWSIVFSPDGKRMASGSQDNMLLTWDIEANGIDGVFEGHTGWVNAVAFSPDGKKLASGSEDGFVKIWDVASNKELFSKRGHAARVSSIVFSVDGKLVISGSDDTTMKLWDVASGAELASLIEIDHQDWLVVTPDGLFDGSPAAWNQILWRFSPNLLDVAPVEIFFNEYYYPGLLADLYAGKRPAAAKNLGQKDRRQAELKISLANPASATDGLATRRVSVKIDIANAPAGAQDVRLFRNGSLVKSWPGDVMKGLGRATLAVEIPIVGGENRLTAYAFNRDNVKSADATLTITGADSLKRAGSLYILAAAVNKYANSQFDLRYAVADADDFALEMKNQVSKLNRYERVEIIPLRDAGATKANFLGALSKLAARIQPEDTIVVYFAGHGVAHQNQFYLIPHDLGYAGDRKQISSTGLQTILANSISDRELERGFEGIDAGQFLFVIDACNSGQALEAEERRRGPMNSRGLAQLAYEKGIYILTAAQSYQAALEPSELQHGLLTYALVEEGLKKGSADSDPRDGTLLVREWLDYAARRVPQIQTEQMRKANQNGRQLVFVDGEEKTEVSKRNVQRPRVFYRRELEAQSFVIAKP